jgi:ParB family chromosome partitioning protein
VPELTLARKVVAMKIAVNDIHISERVRRDLGDIDALAESLARIGQLNPVTVSQRNELIAGHRRVMAAQKLGWQYVEANVVDMTDEADRLELELEENVHRKDFSPEELLEGYRRLDKLRRPKVVARVGGFFKSIFLFLFGWMKPKHRHKDEPSDVKDAPADKGRPVEAPQAESSDDDPYQDIGLGGVS